MDRIIWLRMIIWKRSLFIIFCFLSLVVLHLLSLVHQGITYDEPNHYAYGQTIASGQSVKVWGREGTAMPFSGFNVIIPRMVGEVFSFTGLTKNPSTFETIYSGRYVTILFSLILAWLVMSWATELYGLPAGLAALFFCCFDPNIIAHSQLVTADLNCALMVTASSYFFWRFMCFGGVARAILSAFILGMAPLAKYSCMALYPLFFLFIVVTRIPWLMGCIYENEFRILWKKVLLFLGYCILFCTVIVFTINLGYFFNKSGTPLKGYHFYSPIFKELQKSTIADLPLPLPTPFLEGLDDFLNTDTNGAPGLTYLLGHTHPTGHGNRVYGYFFWALLFKTPIALMIIFFWAIFNYLRRWIGGYYFFREDKSFINNEAYLFLPVVFYLIYFNYCISVQVGIRHVLYVFPLCWIFASSVFLHWKQQSPIIKSALYALSLYLLISTVSYFPHFISYFNEIVFDRRQAYKFLADSNLDWGGTQWYVDEYIKKHPDTIFEPPGPMNGHIMVGVNHLAGLTEPEKYRWLRENYEPVDQVAYNHLVYDVKNLK